MKPPSKRGLWIVLATLVAVGLVAFVASRPWGEPTGPRLPAFDAAEVTLRHPTKGPLTTSLSPADVARLRTELEGARRIQARKWIFAGEFRFFQAGVQVGQANLFWDGAQIMGLATKDGHYLPKPGGLMRDLLDANDLLQR